MFDRKGFLQGWTTLERALLAVIALLGCGAALVAGVVFAQFGGVLGPDETPVAQATATPTFEPLGTDVPDITNATISLNPNLGAPGSTVTVQGEGWPAESRVIIYLVPSSPPNFAVNSAVAGADGRFSVELIVPSDPRWLDESPVPVLAETFDPLPDGRTISAQTLLTIVTPPDNFPGATPMPITATPAPLSPTPTLPPPPSGVAQLTVLANLNVRSGPSIAYDILGVFLEGQTAEITGRNPEGTWWQVKFPGARQGFGWVSAQYTTARNIGNVPIVNVPPPPPTPTPVPTATPVPGVVITDWRGEYYNNPNLSGPPVLVRNDISISFDWGTASPAPQLPADNFSVRWGRNLNFAAGTYRFYARVDDGLRLYIDNALLIDQWRESSPVTYQADVYLTSGGHDIRMEYFERGGGAVAILAWERIDDFPDWKAEYYNNPSLRGDPILVRNEGSINYNWGLGAPAPQLPADNFSARWTRRIYFESGNYTVRVHADDGVRVWIDNELVLDRWQDGNTGLLETNRFIPAGARQVRVEYYERGGEAFIGLGWQRRDREPIGPVAIIRSPAEAVEDEPVIFDGSRSRRGDYKIVKYEWDFGDGTRARDEKVSHTYRQPGTYQVSLTVTDQLGLRDRTRVDIRIVEDLSGSFAPIAVIDAPTIARVGQIIPFDSNRSVAANPIVRAEWSFGDGTTAQGRTVSHTYSVAGLYEVTLTLVDERGLRGSSRVQIRVDNPVQPPPGPVARIVAPESGQAGQPVTFDASTSTSVAPLVSYEWNFGDGAGANAVQVAHIYEAAGLYNVTLTLTDGHGRSNTANKIIQILAEPPPQATPIPVISLSPAQAIVGQVVTFDASGSQAGAPIVRFDWSFGDGITDTGRTVNHIYSQPGRYQVMLTIVDQNNLSNSAATTYEVIAPAPPPPPVAAISGPPQAEVGASVIFNAGGSQIPDRTEIVNFQWSFGDGAGGNNAYEVSHAYQQVGVYEVSLVLTDQYGQQSNRAVTQIQIVEPPPPENPPVPVISGPSSAQVGQAVTFNGQNSQVSGQIASIQWDFGDGATAADVIEVTHTYEAPGSYQVSLTLVDQAGRTGTESSSIQVEPAPTPTPTTEAPTPTPTMEIPASTPTPTEPAPQPPTAAIEGPSQAQVGETVIFNGGFSSGESPIVAWNWDFGDGATGSGMGVSHIYNAPGSYPVILRVTDENGQSDESPPFFIEIIEEAPTPTPTPEPTPVRPPVAAIEVSPNPQVGIPVDFNGGFSSGDNPLVEWIWNFGDGGSATGMGVSHTYSEAGDYEVSLTVVDQNGLQNTATVVVSVAPEPPTPTPIPPTPTLEPPTPTATLIPIPILTPTLTVTAPLTPTLPITLPQPITN